MSKKIELAYNDVNYTLLYTRQSVVKMEEKGFDIKKLESQPAKQLYLLFEGAFYANYSKGKLLGSGELEEMLVNIRDKESLLAVLIEMLGETYETLMGDNEEGKVSWSIV